MLLKRISAVLLALALCLTPVLALDADTLASDCALVMCADTGDILFEKNGATAARPASVTKLMTALLTLESGKNLNATTKVTPEALDVEYDSTRIGLVEGETVTLKDMLYATMIGSANDAANVLAEAIGGTIPDFVEQMNTRAAELGCTGTQFTNPNGLDSSRQHCTAQDIALITRELLKHPEFAEISAIRDYIIPASDLRSEAYEITCRQSMLLPDSDDYYPAAFAGKNGYTSKALQTQVLAAEADGMTLISVVLHCPTKEEKVADTRALLDYGFDNYQLTRLTASDIRTAVQKAGFDPARAELTDLTICLPKDANLGNLTVSDGGDGQLSLELAQNPTVLGAIPYAEPAADSMEGTEASAPVQAPKEPSAVAAFFRTFFASFRMPDSGNPADLLNEPNVRITLVIAGALFLLIFLLWLFLSVRYTHLRRRREELSAMLQTAAERTDDEFNELLRRNDRLDQPSEDWEGVGAIDPIYKSDL